MAPNAKPTSIRSQIYWASGFLVATCVIGNIAGWFGQRSLLANIASSEEAERIAEKILEVDRSTVGLKARAENYVQTGAESSYSVAIRILQQLNSDLSDLSVANQDQELASAIPRMQQHLQTFGEQLELAAIERSVRTELVQTTLPAQDDRVDEAIAALRVSLNKQGELTNEVAGDTNRLIKAIGDFATARKHILAYFIQPRSARYQAMLASLALSRQQFAAMQTPEGSSDVQNAIEAVLVELDRYRALATRAVQATRGYMFYVNVVMAGEISEFSYYSNELKRIVADRQAANRMDRQSAVRNFKYFSLAVSIGAVLLAVVLAIHLATLILKPITLLTDTFLSLARGETVDQIPASDRTDEIGRMAQAASVFSRKNTETETLLQRSRELSDELAEKASMLEESNRELDNFAYVASHDLKSPLRGIKSLAEWVSEDCESVLPPDSQKHLTQMQSRVDKMDELLNDLLSYSRIGKQAKTPEWVGVDSIVRNVIEMADNPHGIQIEIEPDLPGLTTYRTPLQQVLMNLITNAIKYNDKGPEGRISVTTRDLGDSIRFSICDNGTGIDPMFHERIFQMYQRVAPEQTDGTGMGLAIVKRHVECQGGSIELESIPGNGSLFTFTWPKLASDLDSVDEHPAPMETKA